MPKEDIDTCGGPHLLVSSQGQELHHSIPINVMLDSAGDVPISHIYDLSLHSMSQILVRKS